MARWRADSSVQAGGTLHASRRGRIVQAGWSLRALIVITVLGLALAVHAVLELRAVCSLLLCLDLQIAVGAERRDVTDDRSPDPIDVGRARQLVHAQEGQEQRQEDERGLVEVATEGGRRGGQRVNDGELDHIVQERQHPRQHQPRDRCLVQRPHPAEDLPIGHRVPPEDLRPLTGHRLLQEHGDRQKEKSRRNRHVCDGVVHIQLRLAQHAREREVQRATEQGGDADEDAEEHVLGLALLPRGEQPRHGEDACAEDAKRHQRDLLRAARPVGVQLAQSQQLLGQERRERQARADDEIHRDADVAQTEVVQGDVQRKHAAEDDDGENLEPRGQRLRHVPVLREVHRGEEHHEHDEGNDLLHRS
mmetsp:Transcript_86226/g.248997  ORF Transcript_86226/g.248997 Transcript_86226/m.248997 type:complete len:363 (-) Transcript_86226:390-1478(-)